MCLGRGFRSVSHCRDISKILDSRYKACSNPSLVVIDTNQSIVGVHQGTVWGKGSIDGIQTAESLTADTKVIEYGTWGCPKIINPSNLGKKELRFLQLRSSTLVMWTRILLFSLAPLFLTMQEMERQALMSSGWNYILNTGIDLVISATFSLFKNEMKSFSK